MLLPIPDVLSAAQVAEARRVLEGAEWVDGRVTAGHQSVRAKDNMQLPEGSEAARQLGQTIVTALERNPLFPSAALPRRVLPPLFNRYRGGQSFGTHVDNAIRQITGTPTGCGRTFQPRSSWPSPPLTTVEISWPRTPSACTL